MTKRHLLHNEAFDLYQGAWGASLVQEISRSRDWEIIRLAPLRSVAVAFAVIPTRGTERAHTRGSIDTR